MKGSSFFCRTAIVALLMFSLLSSGLSNVFAATRTTNDHVQYKNLNVKAKVFGNVGVNAEEVDKQISKEFAHEVEVVDTDSKDTLDVNVSFHADDGDLDDDGTPDVQDADIDGDGVGDNKEENGDLVDLHALLKDEGVEMADEESNEKSDEGFIAIAHIQDYTLMAKSKSLTAVKGSAAKKGESPVQFVNAALFRNNANLPAAKRAFIIGAIFGIVARLAVPLIRLAVKALPKVVAPLARVVAKPGVIRPLVNMGKQVGKQVGKEAIKQIPGMIPQPQQPPAKPNTPNAKPADKNKDYDDDKDKDDKDDDDPGV